MKFWKMNGAGNDFIIFNNTEEKIPEADLPRIARTLCRRRLSLGADGLIVVDAPSGQSGILSNGLFASGGFSDAPDRKAPARVNEGLFASYSLSGMSDSRRNTDQSGMNNAGSGNLKRNESADFRMLFFNADGSPGEMCGNGARCVCRYGYETGLSGSVQRVETAAGLVTGERIDERNYKIKLNNPSVIRPSGKIEIDGASYSCAYVELGEPGVPHALVPYPDLKNADENALRELGRKIRWHSDFPKGANVNFYEFTGEDILYEKTFERGVEDFTLACGTGTGSLVSVLTLTGQVSGKQVRVDMAGGRLIIDAEQDDGKITALYLTGPTNLVAKGEIFDEEL